MIAGRMRRAEIARLNDLFRSTGIGGEVFLTAGVAGLPASELDEIVAAVRHFDRFTPDNDPYGEHDFASLVVGEHRIIWKIDYYPLEGVDRDPDPAVSKRCRRIMTIMLAEEY